MLNNITNFFNLIKTGKVKTQLDGTDLLPIGTRDNRFTGQYQPTMIKYSDLVAGLVGGSNGQVLFNDNDTIAGASNLYWDKLNERVGIGTSTPSTTFAIGSGGINRVNLGLQAFEMYTPSSVRTVFLGYSSTSGQLIIASGGSNDVNFLGGGFKSISTGNFAIGSTTDAGYKLDVNGTARFTGIVRYNNTSSNYLNIDGSSSGTNNCVISNRFNQIQIITNTGAGAPHISLLPATGGNVGIGTSSPSTTLHVVGQATISTSLSISGGFVMTESGNVHTFTAPATNRTIRFITNSQSYSLFSTGNFAIGTTTDAGYKLDVNGTARVSGDMTIATASGATLTLQSNNSNIVWTSGAFGIYFNTTRLVRFGNDGTIRFAQNIIVAGTTNSVIDSSAILQANSTTQGFLPPRMTTTQKNAIATPATGLMVYDTDLNRPCFFNGTSWITL